MRASARRDAEETIEDAETRARELARSAEAIWRERRRLIEDMRATGEQLVAIGRDVERLVLARAVRLYAEDRVVLAGARTVVFG